MPHQKPPYPTALPHYPFPPQNPHYSPSGFNNMYPRRPDEPQHYAQSYYDQECNDRSDDGWGARMSQQTQQAVNMEDMNNGKKGNSHESDEEAAASALLISAGGPRRADVEKQKERDAIGVKSGGAETTMHQACHVSEISLDGQENGSLISTSTNIDETRNSINFPTVLHDVLTDSEFSGSVLEWLPSGKSWRVLRWDDLANKVVPAHFPEVGCKYSVSKESTEQKTPTSDRINRFLQHLKVWGFEEIKEVGPEMGTYQHEFFIRIAPNLCRHMKITKTNDASSTTSTESSPKKTINNMMTPPRSAPMSSSAVVRDTYLDSPVNTRPIGLRMTGVVSVSPKKRKGEMIEQENKPSPMGRNPSRFVTYSDHEGNQQPPTGRSNLSYRTASPSFLYNGRRIPQGSPQSYVSPSSQGQNYVSPLSQSEALPPSSKGQGLPLFVGAHSDRSEARSAQIPVSPYTSFESVPRQRRVSTTPRTQSNRGGGRACRLDHRDETDKRSPLRPPPSRSSFPVSNRGKGRRAQMVRTMPQYPIHTATHAEMIRNNANGSCVNIADLGKDGIEGNAIGDHDDGTKLKRRRLDGIAADEAMLI